MNSRTRRGNVCLGVLARVVFPLGELTKPDTRLEAARHGLRTAAKPESQDLCLADHHGSMRAFLDVGFDNLLYISLESKKAPKDSQKRVRKVGILIAIALRIVLLFVLVSIIGFFKEPFSLAQYDAWARRDLSARHYVYIWADGVYLQARMEENAECMLVIIGATPEGKKELIGFQVGLRESAQSWHELLADIKGRGLSVPPEIAVGDGAMGFWNALDRAFPSTKHQRCWVHKVKNIQNCFPKQMAPAVKSDLDDIQHAETRKDAEAALTVFCEKYGVKYEKGVGPA